MKPQLSASRGYDAGQEKSLGQKIMTCQYPMFQN